MRPAASSGCTHARCSVGRAAATTDAGYRSACLYLYMIEDLYSRRIIGWDVLEYESADEAGQLVERTCCENEVDSSKLHLHSDNGGPMKGATMLATLQRLGVVASFSRPRVSDDNPYAEALFRTLKYQGGRAFRQVGLFPPCGFLGFQPRKYAFSWRIIYRDRHCLVPAPLTVKPNPWCSTK
ncbi:MAG: DDE-type integrase/transposase/recombinase [Polyangiaceae bacterium]